MKRDPAIRQLQHVQYTILLGFKRDLRAKLNLHFKLFHKPGFESFDWELFCHGKYLGSYTLPNIAATFTVLLLMEQEKIGKSIPVEIFASMEN